MAEAMAPQLMSEMQVWSRWNEEISSAQKDPKYVAWLQSSELILKRYRDERKNAFDKRKRKLNILWSNVQTLKPAVYSQTPKPVVERRFLDRDPAAALASTILERCLSVQMENGYFDTSVNRAVMDYLLPGAGFLWLRYEPKIESDLVADENAQVEAQERTAEDVEEYGDGTPYERLAYERVCVDYVYYKDYLWGSARFWNEVPWVSRRSWLTTSEIAEKFYGGDMELAKKISLDYTPDKTKDASNDNNGDNSSYSKKAEIWEIWNKADQTVYFIAPGTPGIVLKTEKSPVLKLEGFWPTPAPIFATQTNDTVVPVPDYIEYQDQAGELDDLTGRIAALTTALRVNGVYDSSVPELARLLQEGQDNRLIPVAQWNQFAEKGGVPGAISLVPIKEIADVLIGLYSARAQVKNDLYEVTGMSDIVRGQSEGGKKTATEQRIKGQFASLRLSDRQKDVARLCRDTICIMAEIISEMFSDEILLEMSGVGLMIEDDVRKAVEDVPQPPPPPQDGSMTPQKMQMVQQQAMAAYQQAQAQVAQQKRAEWMEKFSKAVQILRSDKLRGFRVDIETDSTIAADEQADKQAATELVASTIQGLQNAGPVIVQAPELMQPIGEMLMFAFRRYRVGRTLESTLEQALDKIQQRIDAQKNQPPPPTPEQIKAQAEAAKQQAESERATQKHGMEMEAKQADFALQKQKNDIEIARMREELAIDQQRLQIEREKLEIERERNAMKAASMAASVVPQGNGAIL